MTGEALPEWPQRTVGVLVTRGEGLHAIPVSAPLRAGDHQILLGLHRDRGSLARIRARTEVALLILAEGDVAFTAQGRASIKADPLPGAPDYVAVAIDVKSIADHRQPAFRVDSGIGRRWVDEDERAALGRRLVALRRMAS